MNFLDQAAKSANKLNNGGTTPLSNPFLKPAASVEKAATAAPIKPLVPGAKPPVSPIPGLKPAGLPKPPVGAKPMIPGAKPPVVPAKPVVETPVAEEVKEPVVEETKAPEAEVPATEEVATPEAPAEEKVAKKETKKKTSRKTTKAKEDAPTAAEEQSSVELEEVVIPVTSISYAEAVQAIKSDFVDEEWNTLRDSVEEKVSGILIDSGMTKVQINDLLSQVSILRDEIIVAYTDTKTLFESLTNKEDGLIDRIKRLNAKGTNAEERKVTGTIAVMNYKDRSGNNVNLYELLDETRSRYNFLRSIMDTIDFKKGVLLTMLSAFKNEK